VGLAAYQDRIRYLRGCGVLTAAQQSTLVAFARAV
jgi:hypothetical protein